VLKNSVIYVTLGESDHERHRLHLYVGGINIDEGREGKLRAITIVTHYEFLRLRRRFKTRVTTIIEASATSLLISEEYYNITTPRPSLT
jgi:hypothetical protein